MINRIRFEVWRLWNKLYYTQVFKPEETYFCGLCGQHMPLSHLTDSTPHLRRRASKESEAAE